MKSEKKIHVLYVDDEETNLSAFKATFRRHFSVFVAQSAMEAAKMLEREQIHVLITDQRMPGKSGTQLLENAVKKYPDQIRILLTGYSDTEAIVNAINKGYIFRYIKKPWEENELKAAIEAAYDVYESISVLKSKAQELEDLKSKLEREMDEDMKKRLGL